ncbi:MAG: phosphate ABC transporter permease PstA [Gemmataceae bacterium]|nr:phosphate ABC transporter permease PstA [Gemmataceae bacterium]MCI0741781.1 phosphate ABC transporter permease PstA [Gemmataceae bacterium]
MSAEPGRKPPEAPPSVTTLLGRTLAWSRNRTLLAVLAYVVLTRLGAILNWFTPEWKDVAITGVKGGMALFVSLLPARFLYLVSTVSKTDLEEVRFNYGSFLTVARWGLGATLILASYLLLVQLLGIALGWFAPNMAAVLYRLVLLGLLYVALLMPRHYFLPAAAAALFVYVAFGAARAGIGSDVSWGEEFARGLVNATFVLLLWAGATFLRFVMLSRSLQDKAFVGVGILATFFGLFMLLIFMWRIANEVGEWFHYVPQLVARQNELTLQARKDLQQTEKIRKDKKDELDRQYRGELIRGDLGEPLPEYRLALERAKKTAPPEKQKNIAELEADLRGADKGDEKTRAALEAAAKEFRASVAELTKEYQAKLKAAAVEVEKMLAAAIKSLTAQVAAEPDSAAQKKLDAMKAVHAEILGAADPYKPVIKHLRKAQNFFRDDVELEKLQLIRVLQEQLDTSDGIFLNERRYEEALAAAPNPKVAEKLKVIKAIQEQFDGKDGLYKTKKRYEAALALAPTNEVQEKLANLKLLQDLFEGPGGVYEVQFADLEIDIAEKKIVADMPLRDTSGWGVFTYFLTHGPSSQPQDAGIYPALLGSLWVGLITLLFAVPVGVGAALYLEEYKHAGWLGKLIQVNINNLAGVPSVVYGILGAFVFVELIFKHMENAYPNAGIAARNVLGGGLTLGLLTLPVVIVAAQEAIRAVPSSIRHGAYALGATHWQVIWNNVLPMARPGILTGTILSLSRAIGEAAPLVLFGALLFVNQDPSLFSRFTVMPMQIFGWADRPALTFDGETIEIWRFNAAMAIVVLMVMLLAMNAVAIVLRNRAQRRMRY